jgi:hypothetical protein
MSLTKTTFAATCPFTGEKATRKSAHAYTHALAFDIACSFPNGYQSAIKGVVSFHSSAALAQKAGQRYLTKGWTGQYKVVPVEFVAPAANVRKLSKELGAALL